LNDPADEAGFFMRETEAIDVECRDTLRTLLPNAFGVSGRSPDRPPRRRKHRNKTQRTRSNRRVKKKRRKNMPAQQETAGWRAGGSGSASMMPGSASC
jgi:hypothetical protein